MNDGYLILDPIPEGMAVVEACKRIPLESLGGPKPFLQHMTAPPEAHVLAANTDIMAAVDAYQGPSKVESVDLFYSVYIDRPYYKSQIYHCDSGYDQMVKLFLYCSDVEPENGPFTFYRLKDSDRFREYAPNRKDPRVSDRLIQGYTLNPPYVFTGPAGSMALVDTGKCFHMGARVEPTAAPRLMLSIQYVTLP